MTIRHLDSFFDPSGVAIIGASGRPGSVGATVWRNLREGGFTGPVWPVNPRHARLDGHTVYPTVAALPHAPELAVICTPAATVPGLVAELAARGTRAAVVMSAGVKGALRQAMLDAARPALLRILGPNCIGLLAPHFGLNASFAHIGAQPGSLAFVSQSGALVTAMLDWARGRGIGFSQVVSLGEHADADFADLLDWLATDARTRAILLYIESIEKPRKFISAARAAARNKPVIVVKSGRTQQGQQAAASHTGAMAGSDAVFDAAIRRAGMLRVDSLQELLIAAETLAHFQGHPRGPLAQAAAERVLVFTNGGGAGVMAADAAGLAGLPLVELEPATLERLDAVLPANWSRGNPVDIIGDAPAARYADAWCALRADASLRAGASTLFIHAPTAIVPSTDIARALLDAACGPKVPEGAAVRMLGCWLGTEAVAGARQVFHEAGIPCHDTPEAAVRALAMLAEYRRNQDLLLEAPPARPQGIRVDMEAARALVAGVLADGREWLAEHEAKDFLALAGVPVVETRRVELDEEAAVAAARGIGFPVALKILSPDLLHKSDAGGVALDLDDEADLRQALQHMLQRVRARAPSARLEGFTVQAMVRRPQAFELIVGTSVDPLFGPVILFGAGGTAVEVLADRSLALPPLNAPLARALVARTRVARLLAGFRDVRPADLDAVVAVLERVSEMLAEIPEMAELDINPLLADARGVIALDARVRVSAALPGGAAHFAVRPYPTELDQRLMWQGREIRLRPIRPEDEAQHMAFLQRLDPVDVRMRIFHSRRSIERSELARLTQIDYEREMAFIATGRDDTGAEETLGVVRALADPDNVEAEFGIVVRSDLKGGGLGALLMHKLIDYLRQRGTARLVATVLAENDRMLELARELGLEVTGTDADTVSVGMNLGTAPPTGAG